MSLKYVNEGWQNEKLRSKCFQNKERKKVDIYLENTSLILIINNFIGLYVYIYRKFENKYNANIYTGCFIILARSAFVSFTNRLGKKYGKTRTCRQAPRDPFKD